MTAGDSNKEQLYQEVSAQLVRARTALALAHRHAAKLPLEPADQEKSRAELAQAIALCVAATHAAKAHNLYRMADSGLNPSELRRSVQRGLGRSRNTRPPNDRRRPAAEQNRSLMAQLDASRRMNLEGLRCLIQPGAPREVEWRGTQLLKIAEQLCVITAMESKLLGSYVIGSPNDDPASAREAVCRWATEVTRKEIEAE